MRKLIHYLILLVVSLFTCLTIQAQNPEAGRIKIIIENIPNDEGQIIIKLYRNASSFPKAPFKTSMVFIKNHRAEYLLTNVVKGTYAIALIHDKNGNGKLDFNFLHIPKEKVAASNNAKGLLGPPKWTDAQFNVGDDEVVQLIKL